MNLRIWNIGEIFIKIIIKYLYTSDEFFTPVLSDDFSLESADDFPLESADDFLMESE